MVSGSACLPDFLCSSDPETSPVAPSLFVLHPQTQDSVPDSRLLDVCLATNFRPKDGDMILNESSRSDLRKISVSNAVLSVKDKTYFYAGFSNQNIESCELNGVKSEKNQAQVPCEPEAKSPPPDPISKSWNKILNKQLVEQLQ